MREDFFNYTVSALLILIVLALLSEMFQQDFWLVCLMFAAAFAGLYLFDRIKSRNNGS